MFIKAGENKMKKTVIIVMMVVLILSLSASENDLWNKAKQFIENGSNLVPCKIVTTTKEITKKGEEKSRTIISIKTQQEEEGVSVSFIEGTRDNVELTTDDSDVKDALMDDYKPSESTFFEKVVSFKQTSEEMIIHDKQCVAFEYIGESTRTEKKKEVNVTETGKLWVEKSTGFPMIREFSSSPLPKHLKKMDMKIHYEDNENRCTESKVELDIVASLMLMKFRIDILMEFSEHWEYTGL